MFTNITVMSSCSVMVVITEMNINDNIKIRLWQDIIKAQFARFVLSPIYSKIKSEGHQSRLQECRCHAPVGIL